MLSSSTLLTYVKTSLGYPYVNLELTDEQILAHVQTFSIKEFSQYFPDVNKINLDLSDTTLKVPIVGNEYYIEDPDGMEILTVKNIYWPLSDYILHGHPPIGPLTHNQLPDWALSVSMAMDVKMFSSFDKTFEFRHPNIVRISPVPNNIASCTVEYERVHLTDFSTIKNELQMYFMELALADVMILLGRIRTKYSDLKTPFGDIPVNAALLDEGKERKKEIMDKLQAGSLPNIIFDKG